MSRWTGNYCVKDQLGQKQKQWESKDIPTYKNIGTKRGLFSFHTVEST